VLYAGLALWWGGKLVGHAPSRRQVMGFLLFCFLSVPVIQVGLLAGESPDVVEQLYFRAVSSGSSGFFSVGSIIDDPLDFLAHYPELMPTFPVHPQRYPPGIPLLFYASRTPLAVGGVGEMMGGYLRPYQCTDLTLMRISNAVMGTAVLQMLLPLFSALVIFPLFGLARRTLGWGTAVWTVALYPLVPSFALWAGRWDQFFPLLTVVAWYLLVVGLTEKRSGLLLLSGIVLGLAVLLSFGLVIMLAPMGLWALLWLAVHRTEWERWQVIGWGLWFAAGLGVVWAVYELLPGPGLLSVWRVSMDFHLGLARSYWLWLGYHLYDFGIFLGLPLALLCLYAFVYALWVVSRERYSEWREWTLLPIAFGLGVLLLNLSGTARGEVARVWIFLTPFAVMCAVWGLHRLTPARWPVILLMGLLALQLLVFNAFLRVVNTGLTSITTTTTNWSDVVVGQGDPIQFGDAIRLQKYEVTPGSIAAGETIVVRLLWQTAVRLDTPYTVFNHLVNENGELVAQQDGMPQANRWPTTCWQPGVPVADQYVIQTPPDIPPGTYHLLTGWYVPDSGIRLPAHLPATPGGDVAVVGTVVVLERP
ncbi:MAG TPA: glycosyltransferase family 39 protein, partial [Chloroflexota bacterium]|nr:glycosyltransferase family 39 protein [Chloroflexota bacterium]